MKEELQSKIYVDPFILHWRIGWRFIVSPTYSIFGCHSPTVTCALLVKRNSGKNTVPKMERAAWLRRPFSWHRLSNGITSVFDGTFIRSSSNITKKDPGISSHCASSLATLAKLAWEHIEKCIDSEFYCVNWIGFFPVFFHVRIHWIYHSWIVWERVRRNGISQRINSFKDRTSKRNERMDIKTRCHRRWRSFDAVIFSKARFERMVRNLKGNGSKWKFSNGQQICNSQTH